MAGDHLHQQAQFLRKTQFRPIETILEHERAGLDLEAHQPAAYQNIQNKPGVVLDLVTDFGHDPGAHAADRVERGDRLLGARRAQVEMANSPGRQQRQMLPGYRHGAAQRVVNEQRFGSKFHPANVFCVGQSGQPAGFDDFRRHTFGLEGVLQQLDRIGAGQRFQGLERALQLVGAGGNRVRLEEAVGHIKAATLCSGWHPISTDSPAPDSIVPAGRSRARPRGPRRP